MSIYAFLIIAMFAGKFLLDTVADVLNLRRLNGGMADELVDVFDHSEYQKSQAYTAVKTKFGIVQSAFFLVATLFFWWSGGFNALDLYLRGWGFDAVLNGLVYVGALAIGKLLLSLPFRIYATFVIEEQFGFNRTTIKVFILDCLKSILLVLVVGSALLWVVQTLFLYAGIFAWLYASLAVALLTIFFYFIGPTVIMPLFLKFTPLQDGELKEAIHALASRLKFPLSGIFVIDGSRRSTKANAFFAGFGKHKRIALYDTLIEKTTTQEMVNVLAHEIGHYQRKHTLIGLTAGLLQMGLALFLFSFFLRLPGLFSALGMTYPSIYAGLLFFFMGYSLFGEMLSAFSNALARAWEYDADAFTVRTTGTPEVLVGALKKLARGHLSNLCPHPFYVFLHYTHPPLLERFAAIRKCGATQVA